MHPTLVNAVTCAKNAQKSIEELYGDEAVFVPYITPGYILYKEIERLNEQYLKAHGKYPQVFFLQNHGIFVGAETTEEINEKYDWIIGKIKGMISNEMEIESFPVEDKATEIIPAIRAALSANKLKVGKLRNNTLIDSFLTSDEKIAYLANPFTSGWELCFADHDRWLLKVVIARKRCLKILTPNWLSSEPDPVMIQRLL